jgi:Ca2+-binding RTX toxin-like protein
MYHQINPTETFGKRQLALLEESEERRLARRLGITRRTILLMAATMSFVVLVVGGVALAATFTCDDTNCFGTPQDDHITGVSDFSQFFDSKAGDDIVEGRGGFDAIHGRSGADTLDGDGSASPDNAQDFLFGHGGRDRLEAEGGRDGYDGGPGADSIHADFTEPSSGTVDQISAGGGNDTIFANDNAIDVIDCGSGDDTVHDNTGGDSGDVVRSNCEHRGP